MIDVCIEVPLPPRGKDRPRMTRGGIVYTPAATKRWESTLALMAADLMPVDIIDEPVRVDVLAVMPRPKRLLRRGDPDGLIWAPVRPDSDNILKALLDGLKGCWRDDCLVVAGTTLKVYAERTGRPRMLVRVRSVGDPNHAYSLLFGDRPVTDPCAHCEGPLSVTHFLVRGQHVCGDCAARAAGCDGIDREVA